MPRSARSMSIRVGFSVWLVVTSLPPPCGPADDTRGHMGSMPSDRKILFTGATGQAIRPCAEAMAVDNEVWCIARFSKPETKTELEAKGIKTFEWTMGEGSLDGLDDDFT